MANIAFAELSVEQRAQLRQWLDKRASELPDVVRIAMAQYDTLVHALEGSQYKLHQVIVELRRALGLTASSEKRSSGDPLGAIQAPHDAKPKNEKERLEGDVKRLRELVSWHEGLADRHQDKAKDVEKKLMNLRVEDIPLSAEQEARIAKNQEAYDRHVELGSGAEPALESPAEAFVHGTHVAVNESSLNLPAPVADDDKEYVLGRFSETRERFDFSFVVTRINVKVEKAVIGQSNGERRVVSASTGDIGPARYDVTWGLLAHAAILVSQFAMPLNRLGHLLSTSDKRFDSSYVARLFRYTATRFVEIYLALIDELSDSDVICGDDTSTRVLEVKKHFREGGVDAPWKDYRHVAIARETLSATPKTPTLGMRIASEIGFEFERRHGDAPKKSFQTTTLSGRGVADDPRSQIVIYRSHIGSFGNLLEMLLEKRQKSHKALSVQSDLATVNLINNADLQNDFEITYYGCGSHARRPFALYEHEDPDLCAWMLHLFKGFALHERHLSVVGRNRENVLAVRNIDSRRIWVKIKEVAEIIAGKWAPATKLGTASRYIIRHYDKLTAYLLNPRVDWTNNFSERMLRMEKLIESNSLFRTTLEGRFSLDIMRSVLQTATAAEVPLQAYLLHVLRADPDEVRLAPENFTPLAYRRHLAANARTERDSGGAAFDADQISALLTALTA